MQPHAGLARSPWVAAARPSMLGWNTIVQLKVYTGRACCIANLFVCSAALQNSFHSSNYLKVRPYDSPQILWGARQHQRGHPPFCNMSLAGPCGPVCSIGNLRRSPPTERQKPIPKHQSLPGVLPQYSFHHISVGW